MNFVIYAPGDYTPYGGGCIALHKLCHNIASLGEKAFIMTSKKNPEYLGTQVTEQEAAELCKDGIAIYPEVTIGNPFKSKKVMRWILYYVRTNGLHGMFSETDLIYKYAEIFTLRNQQEVHGELRAVELFMDLFVDKGLPRSGSCFIHKKTRPNYIKHPEGCLNLDDFQQKGGNEYLASIFQTRETFYTYDNATWFSIFAAMCGCVSIVIPDGNHTAEEWYQKFPYFRYGIAYGEEEIPHALSTISKLRENLLTIQANTIQQTKDFINKAYTL